MLIEQRGDVRRTRHQQGEGCRRLSVVRRFLVEDVFADVDAVVANVHARAGDELFHLRMAFAAEGAESDVGAACHDLNEISETVARKRVARQGGASIVRKTTARQIIQAALQPDLVLRQAKAQTQFRSLPPHPFPSSPTLQKVSQRSRKALFDQTSAQHLTRGSPARDPVTSRLHRSTAARGNKFGIGESHE
jgi:hypothetical protein